MSTSNRGKAWQLDDKEVADLVAGTHLDPFSRLGIQAADGGFCARAFIPGADRVAAASLDGQALGDLDRRHPAGFFEGKISATGRQLIRFNCANAQGQLVAHRPVQLRPGPRSDGRLLPRRRDASAPLRPARRPPHRPWRRRTASISPSGRHRRAASRSSATSISGTAAATSCATASARACGKSSSPSSPPGPSTSSRSSARPGR